MGSAETLGADFWYGPGYARQSIVLDDGPDTPSAERRKILAAIIAFGHAAVRQLRRETTSQATGEAAPPANSTDGILCGAAVLIGQLLRQARLAPIEALAINENG